MTRLSCLVPANGVRLWLSIIAYNHGKRSLSIALDTAAGLEVFRKLAATADIVIHNLSPSATRLLIS